MRREWRFIARWFAWRRGCATAGADDPRLLADAAEAFVDRRPIDWSALLARVNTPHDRALFENLFALHRIREPQPSSAIADTVKRPPLFVRLLAAIAGVQTILCLAAVAIALIAGESTAPRVPQIALAAAFGSASLLLATATSRDPRSIFLLAAFTGVASAFARAAAAGLPASYLAWLAPLLRGIYPESLTPACVWLFALEFPRVRRFTTFDRVARRLALAACVQGAVLGVVNWAAAYDLVGTTPVVYLLRNHESNGFWSLFALAMIPALATIVVRARRAESSERQRLARFALALAVGTAPVLLSGALRFLWPAFGEWVSHAAAAERRWLDRAIIAALMSTPILGTLALIVDRPFERHEMLPHDVRAAIARGAISTLTAIPFALIVWQLYELRRSPLRDVFDGAQRWPLIAYAVAGAVLLALRPRLLDVLERRGFTRKPSQHERLVRALDRLRMARGAREIGAALAQELRGGTGATTVSVLLRDGVSFVDPSATIAPLAADSVLLSLLRESTRPLDISPARPLLSLLPADDGVWVAANNVELAAGIRTGDCIAAVVVLGPKRRGYVFTHRDRSFIATLTSAAASAWAIEESETVPAASDVMPAVPGSLAHHFAGRFTIEERLGSGSVGTTFRARDVRLGRHVVVKIVEHLGEHDVTRIRAEAQAMAALTHESLATLYGLELWQDTPVLVGEYCPGGTLAHRLQEGPLPATDAVAIATRVARALDYMHVRGVAHGHLTANNIGFTAAGEAKLLDAGLAFDKEPRSPAFDLWALAVLLSESLAVRPPALDAFFARALAYNSASRFETAAEVLASLEAVPASALVVSSK